CLKLVVRFVLCKGEPRHQPDRVAALRPTRPTGPNNCKSPPGRSAPPRGQSVAPAGGRRRGLSTASAAAPWHPGGGRPARTPRGAERRERSAADPGADATSHEDGPGMSATPIPEDEGTEPTPAADASPVCARIDISGRTLARIVIAALLTLAAMWLIASLGDVIVMVLLAVVIAVVLSVFVNWLERKGVKRGLAALLSLVGVLLVVGGVLAITIPP